MIIYCSAKNLGSMFGERKTLQDQLLNNTEDVEMNNLGYFSEIKGREWLGVG